MSVIHDRDESAQADAESTSATDVEAGIREFVRNDISYLRRAPPLAESITDAGADASVNNVNTLIQRVAGASATEIDNLINELENLRALMHEEGQRVQRDLANFAKLSQTAMKSTRIISENLAQWKRPLQQD